MPQGPSSAGSEQPSPALAPCRFQGDIKQSAGDDEIVLRIESGDAGVMGERWHNSLLLAADMDPFALVERAVAAAAAMSGGLRRACQQSLGRGLHEACYSP